MSDPKTTPATPELDALQAIITALQEGCAAVLANCRANAGTTDKKD